MFVKTHNFKKILNLVVFCLLLSCHHLTPPSSHLLISSFPPSSVQHQCLQGALCPVAAGPTAYCGTCDLDPSTTACTWVLSALTHHDISSTTESPSSNTTHETLTTGLPTHTNKNESTYKMADAYSHTHTENLQFGGSLCLTHEEVVYSGDADKYTYTGNLCVFSGKTCCSLEY